MKKLLLTSSGISEVCKPFLELLEKDPSETTVCFIPTAAGFNPKQEFIDKAKDEIKKLGMKLTEVDLEDETQESLLEKLSVCDVIYVNGGNTFYLLDWVRKTGFENVVKQLINEGKIYVGVSAGSYIACPTIEMATWKEKVENDVGLTDLTAMNLVPFLMQVHFEEKMRPTVTEAVKHTKFPVIVLNDKQAVLVNGDKVKVVGTGEIISFNNFSES
ncbi:MAG: Type 1 glutamine amidotransferase-like domain-containing protein [Patescibacteria group bacterium]